MEKLWYTPVLESMEDLNEKFNNLNCEIDTLNAVIQCLLKDTPNHERKILNSDLQFALDCPDVIMEERHCEECEEGYVRVYLHR